MTKFLHWFKMNKKNITEKYIETKLENFRKKSKNYLFPSFDTIAGSGPNGAIIHYKSTNQTNRNLKKNDILFHGLIIGGFHANKKNYHRFLNKKITNLFNLCGKTLIWVAYIWET